MNGKAHATATALIGLPLSAASAYALHKTGLDLPALLVGTAVGTPLAILVNPDLDQEGFSRVEWDLIKKTSLLGFIWLALWYPYAVKFDHRSTLSHLPVLGTLLRIFYLGIFPMLYEASTLLAISPDPKRDIVIKIVFSIVIYYLLSCPIVYMGIGISAVYWVAKATLWGTRTHTLGTGVLVTLLISDALHAIMDIVPTKTMKVIS